MENKIENGSKLGEFGSGRALTEGEPPPASLEGIMRRPEEERAAAVTAGF